MIAAVVLNPGLDQSFEAVGGNTKILERFPGSVLHSETTLKRYVAMWLSSALPFRLPPSLQRSLETKCLPLG
jgi:hypothetical protein